MAHGFNMEERKEPKFVQFAEGEVVEGVLVAIDAVEVGEEKKRTPRFTVRDLETRELFCFLGTYDIATKLKRSDIGHVVSVRYEGEDKNVTRNGNAMKRFHIAVSDRPFARAKEDAAVAGTVITDDDIPF